MRNHSSRNVCSSQDSSNGLPNLARRLPYPGELPIELDPVAYQTIRHRHYRPDAEADWESMFPQGYPLEAITNQTLLREKALTSVPSVYNQLWCLNNLRKIWRNPGWQNDTCKDNQVHRCMNMLRQALLCNGDTSLEPVVDIKDEKGVVVERGATGTDVVHVCRDWIRIRGETEKMFNKRFASEAEW